jgi:hypothetical protein
MEFKVGHLAYTNLSKQDQACTRLVRKGLKLLYKAHNPLSTDYCPKIDVMPELGEADALY